MTTYDDLLAALRRALARELGRSNTAIVALTMARTAEDLFEVARQHRVKVGFVVVPRGATSPTSVFLH